MHVWTMVTGTPVWRGIARAKTGKDRRVADGLVMEVFWASDVSSGQRRRCIKWADGPAEWSTGLCPRLLDVADDNGWRRQTTRMADEDGDGRRHEIAITPDANVAQYSQTFKLSCKIAKSHTTVGLHEFSMSQHEQ